MLYQAVKAKFEQNRTLQQLLLMTGDFELVEASQHDRNCGIGYHARHALQAKSWGQNLLGKALMGVRAELRESRQAEDLPTQYSFSYFRHVEELLNERRYIKRNIAAAKKPKNNRKEVDTPYNIKLLAEFVEQWPKVTKFGNYFKIHDESESESDAEDGDGAAALADGVEELGVEDPKPKAPARAAPRGGSVASKNFKAAVKSKAASKPKATPKPKATAKTAKPAAKPKKQPASVPKPKKQDAPAQRGHGRGRKGRDRSDEKTVPDMLEKARLIRKQLELFDKAEEKSRQDTSDMAEIDNSQGEEDDDVEMNPEEENEVSEEE